MVLAAHRRAVGVFVNRRDAEHALHELRDSGFPMDRVSVIVRDADRNDDIAGAEVREKVGNKADEGAVKGAVTGGTLGGLTGLLVGLGLLAIPGIGPVMLAGATATTIATTLSGTAIGAAAGSLLGALIGLGIPEERARVYNERVSRGEYLVIVDGSDEEIRHAHAILHRGGIQEFGIYDRPHSERVPTEIAATTATATPVVTTVPTARNKNAVGYFSLRSDAESAIADLRKAGFPMSQVSLIAQNVERRGAFSGIDIRDRFDAMRLGFPDDRARFYNDRVVLGDYVVIVNGTEDEVERAAAILRNRGVQEWQIYDPTEIGDRTLQTATTTATPTPTVVTATAPVASTPATATTKHKRAVGVFAHRSDAEAAIAELRDAHFPMKQVSVIAKDADRHDSIAGVDMKPGTGNAGGLAGLGIPEDQARIYGDRLSHGDYLVILDGTEDEINRAIPILRRRGIDKFAIYDSRDLDQSDRAALPHTTDRTQAPVDHPVGTEEVRVISQHPDVIIIDRRDQTP